MNKIDSIVVKILAVIGAIAVVAYLLGLGLIKTQEEQTTIQELEKIVEEYHESHTYSLVNLFVCTDSSIDVWNLVKTKGINAKICAGNVEEDLSEINDDLTFFRRMNHAWVIAESEPFKWIALETTGGYLVWGEGTEGEGLEKNDLYYKDICFDNPAEFKKFISLRDDYIVICTESREMVNYWNENYAGEYVNQENTKYEGRLEQKIEECAEVSNQLSGLLT